MLKGKSCNTYQTGKLILKHESLVGLCIVIIFRDSFILMLTGFEKYHKFFQTGFYFNGLND